MKRKLITMITLFLILAGCTSKTPTGKMNVYVSVYVLEEFATLIGGDNVEVINVVPPGIEPHDFELGAQEIVALSKADLLLTIGLGFEPWLDDLENGLGDTYVVRTGEQLDGGLSDPHLWLDPLLAREVASTIRDALITIDPSNANLYNFNYEELKTKLESLETEYKTRLASRIRDTFVSSHDAFGYLAKAYGLRQESIAGKNPLEDVDAKRLKEIIDLIKTQKIPVVFTEALIDPKIAQTIVQATGAEILTLDPIESLSSEQRAAGEDYFSVMEANLDALEIALTKVVQ